MVGRSGNKDLRSCSHGNMERVCEILCTFWAHGGYLTVITKPYQKNGVIWPWRVFGSWLVFTTCHIWLLPQLLKEVKPLAISHKTLGGAICLGSTILGLPTPHTSSYGLIYLIPKTLGIWTSVDKTWRNTYVRQARPVETPVLFKV